MDWIPDFIWNNWGGWMSFLADERVEHAGSVLLGFAVACMVYVLLSPVILLTMRRRWWYAPLAVVVLACGLVGYGVAVQVHDVWNGYQHWFTQPGDPSWQPVTPDPQYTPSTPPPPGQVDG